MYGYKGERLAEKVAFSTYNMYITRVQTRSQALFSKNRKYLHGYNVNDTGTRLKK